MLLFFNNKIILSYWHHSFNSNYLKPTPHCRFISSPPKVCIILAARHCRVSREWRTEHLNWTRNNGTIFFSLMSTAFLLILIIGEFLSGKNMVLETILHLCRKMLDLVYAGVFIDGHTNPSHDLEWSSDLSLI